ncbi:MAG: hypothetical protein HXS54_05740 [Theionarchaea archaeon]|nr:hypothetical protein [Theionarchaea archaeon]
MSSLHMCRHMSLHIYKDTSPSMYFDPGMYCMMNYSGYREPSEQSLYGSRQIKE